jgi:hypothetical protein
MTWITIPNVVSGYLAVGCVLQLLVLSVVRRGQRQGRPEALACEVGFVTAVGGVLLWPICLLGVAKGYREASQRRWSTTIARRGARKQRSFLDRVETLRRRVRARHDLVALAWRRGFISNLSMEKRNAIARRHLRRLSRFVWHRVAWAIGLIVVIPLCFAAFVGGGAVLMARLVVHVFSRS